MTEPDLLQDKPDYLRIFTPPFFLVVILWFIKYCEWKFHLSFVEYGLYPLSFEGLRGILLSPLIHSDFNHLLSNSFPLFVLGGMMLHFYKRIAYKIFFIIYILSNVGAWFFARPSYHIGASGVVYGLVCFLFLSGVVRKHMQLLALSMLVTFLYGGLVWGVFPLPTGISWESHLSGSVVGFACAIIFRKQGPQKPEYKWDEEDEKIENGEWNEIQPPETLPPDEPNGINILYHFPDKKN